METGLRQVGALFIRLFNIALKSIVRNIQDNLRIAEGRQVALATYANYIIFVERTDENVRYTTEKLINS